MLAAESTPWPDQRCFWLGPHHPPQGQHREAPDPHAGPHPQTSWQTAEATEPGLEPGLLLEQVLEPLLVPLVQTQPGADHQEVGVVAFLLDQPGPLLPPQPQLLAEG